MRTDLSPTLEAEQTSLTKNPKAKITVERWLPEWSQEQSPVTTGYYHGHGVCVQSNNIYRARVNGSGQLETSVHSIVQPSGWEAQFAATSFPNSLISPKWNSNTSNNYGADVEVVPFSQSTGPTVFAVQQNGDVVAIALDSSGDYASHDVVVSLGTIVNSVQLGSDNYQILHVMEDALVEQAQDAWQDDIYGSKIRRFEYGVGWTEDSNPFMFHTHSKGTLLTNNGVSLASDKPEAQWGFRSNGGLAAFKIDETYDLVVFSTRYYWQKSYVSGTMGLIGFLYNKINAVWTLAWQHDQAEFEEDYQLWSNSFVKGFSIEGVHFVSWVRINEPSGFIQDDNSVTFSRQQETVIAKVTPNGLSISNPVYFGDDETMCGASVVVGEVDGAKVLFAIGYEKVDSSPAATFLCTVPDDDRLDLELYSTSYTVDQNGTFTMPVTVPLVDASARFDTFLKEGNIVRVYQGIFNDLEQIGMGYIESVRPTYSLEAGNNSATMTCRAELQLHHTKNESIEDWIPLQTYLMEPKDDGLSSTTDVIDGRESRRSQPSTIELKGNGWFLMSPPQWQSKFFSGVFETIDLVYRNEAYPQALTGGGTDVPPGVVGGPGSVAEQNKTGTMFSDLFWMRMEPKVDLAIQGSFRFGDVKNANDFGFTTSYDTYTSVHPQRSNGLITETIYRDINGDEWNRPTQESVAAGLIFRSVHDPLDPDGTAKKYIFIWEANSNLTQGSHLEDQAGNWWSFGTVFDQPDYGGLPVGRNKLYLFISDFDETDENWQSSDKYVHKAILETDATGLITGQPADLKLQVLGGRVHCFYRPYQLSGQAPYLWRKAFDYNTGHFGAGRAGCVARGHMTITWDAFQPAADQIRQLANVVDTWDVEATDCNYDLTIEELVERYANGGHTETEFRTLVSETHNLIGGNEQTLNVESLNFCIDVYITAQANGEAGIYFRANPTTTYKDDGLFAGLRFDSTYEGDENVINCYAVLREWSGGAETEVNRQYSPSVIHLQLGKEYKCRFSVREDLIIVYVEQNYIGHFRSEFAPGKELGLATDIAANFTVELQELNEVPENALVDPSSNMMSAINNVIGNRPIKGVFRWNGKLLVSKFDTHDSGPTLEDLVLRSSLILSDRFINIVEVQGANGYATYVYDPKLPEGRRYKLINQANIFGVEQCYDEAKRVVRESMERLEQVTVEMPMDIRIEPEDSVILTVVEHDISSKEYYVTDVGRKFNFEGGQSMQVVSLRQRFDL